MMYWLIRATQVTGLTYRIVLTTMMTAYLIREGLSSKQRSHIPQLPPPPNPKQ